MKEYERREIERAIHAAEHPVGMGPHTGMARISAATLRRLLRRSDQRDELLVACKGLLEVWEEDPAYGGADAERARAAIQDAEGA